MYEWKTLRIVASILLCLPLVHFAYIVARDMSDYLNPSPEVWNDELAALVESDMGTTLPSDPVVVIGGLRVQFWTDLPSQLRPHATLLRPLGDATLEDMTYHYDRLAGFYQPELLVVFPGYGDLHLRDDKSSDDYGRALRELLAKDSSYESTRWRYVISPIEMPLHSEDARRIASMAATGQGLAQSLPRLTVIDANPLLRGSNGKPDPAFFRADGINLNDRGYARISLLLREAMRERGDLG